MGGRAGFVLQELGHSLFANCFRNTSDPMHAGIYTSAGIDAGDLWGGGPHSSIDCPDATSAEMVTPIPPALPTKPYPFYDCRNDVAEHYFLALLVHYRLDGDEFRALISSTSDPSRKTRLMRQYNWFKQVWFNGAEYKRGPAVNASLTQDGLLCLPGECTLGVFSGSAAQRTAIWPWIAVGLIGGVAAVTFAWRFQTRRRARSW
jgi:hypothetical protein